MPHVLFKLILGSAYCVIHKWLIAFCTVKWNRVARTLGGAFSPKTWGRVYLGVGSQLNSWHSLLKKVIAYGCS